MLEAIAERARKIGIVRKQMTFQSLQHHKAKYTSERAACQKNQTNIATVRAPTTT